MSESDELDAIRQRKREQLERQVGDGEAADEVDTAGDAGDEATSESPTEPIHVSGEDHLNEVVGANRVVLLDFHADWCGPCKMLEPIVEQLAAETDAAVAKVDVDTNQSLAAQFGVRGVPTLVLFADGEPVEQLVGVQDKARLQSLIEQHGG